MKLYPACCLPVEKVIRFVVIFYSVAVIGFLLPWTKSLFVLLTPAALLLSIYLAGIYHNRYTTTDWVVFLAVSLAGFFVEVVGVSSGAVFGTYQYGSALGPKIFETPPLIGLNWLFLTYTSLSLSEKIIKNRWLQWIVAPLLMVGYDLVLEQIAPAMNMWQWDKGVVPLRNYLAWWVLAMLFTAVFKIFKINTINSLAIPLFVAQFCFFLILLLFQMFGI